MIVEIIGIQKVDYEKKDGSGRVQGNTIYIARDIPSDRGCGVAVEKEYISGNQSIKFAFSFFGFEIFCKGFSVHILFEHIITAQKFSKHLLRFSFFHIFLLKIKKRKQPFV